MVCWSLRSSPAARTTTPWRHRPRDCPSCHRYILPFHLCCQVLVYCSISDNLTSFHLQLWKHYNAGTLMEILDPNLRDQCSEAEALKVFQVGLLCAQASPNLRPPMWKVVEMLGSGDRVLPRPTEPPFINVKGSNAKSESSGSSMSLMSNSDKSPFSTNQLSVSGVQAR